jgi:hypothetical protein
MALRGINLIPVGVGQYYRCRHCDLVGTRLVEADAHLSYMVVRSCGIAQHKGRNTDQILTDGIGKGEFDLVPGHGDPLVLDFKRHVVRPFLTGLS